MRHGYARAQILGRKYTELFRIYTAINQECYWEEPVCFRSECPHRGIFAVVKFKVENAPALLIKYNNFYPLWSWNTTVDQIHFPSDWFVESCQTIFWQSTESCGCHHVIALLQRPDWVQDHLQWKTPNSNQKCYWIAGNSQKIYLLGALGFCISQGGRHWKRIEWILHTKAYFDFGVCVCVCVCAQDEWRKLSSIFIFISLTSAFWDDAMAIINCTNFGGSPLKMIRLKFRDIYQMKGNLTRFFRVEFSFTQSHILESVSTLLDISKINGFLFAIWDPFGLNYIDKTSVWLIVQ